MTVEYQADGDSEQLDFRELSRSLVPSEPPPVDTTLRQPLAMEFYYFLPTGNCLTYSSPHRASASNFPLVATFPLEEVDILIPRVVLDPESQLAGGCQAG